MTCQDFDCACWRHPTFDHALYALERTALETIPTDLIKRLSAARFPTLPPLRGARASVLSAHATRLALYPRK